MLVFPCTIKSRSSLLVPAHPGGPEKRAVKRLYVWCGVFECLYLWTIVTHLRSFCNGGSINSHTMTMKTNS